MNRILCVAVLLLGTIALTGRSSTAAPVGPDYPQIVAKGKLLNQNAPIATTTIYTPAHTGLYRLSVYATLTTVNEFSTSQWDYNVGWTDDAGVQSIPNFLYQQGNVLGQFFGSDDAIGYQGGIALPFEAKAGTPITYSMTQYGSPDNSAYNLYYTLERLE
jgi:hypothetical protein